MDSLLGALATKSSVVSPQPSPAQPSQPSPAQDCPVSVIPQADAAFRTAVQGIRRRVEFALTVGGGRDAGPVLQRTRLSSLGSHAPCSSLPLGVSRSLAIMTPASRPSVCWMLLDGRVPRRRCHRCASVHGQAARGAKSTQRAPFCAGTVVGLDGSHNTHWEWSGPTPGSLAGRGPDEGAARGKQNVTRRAAGRLVERLASIPTQRVPMRILAKVVVDQPVDPCK